jgi:hypothetical protein
MSKYQPDWWVLLKLTYEDETFYKVLGSWSGSMLYGNSWRLNSRVVSVVDDKDYYYFVSQSDSVYSCHKDFEGLTTTTYGVYNQLKEKFGDNIELIEDAEPVIKEVWGV